MSRTKALRNATLMVVFVLILLPAKTAAYRADDFHWIPPFLVVEEKPSVTFILDTSIGMLERAYLEPFDAAREYYGYFDPKSGYGYNADSQAPHFFADNSTGQWNGNFLNWATMLRVDVARKILSGGKFDAQSGCYELEPRGNQNGTAWLDYDDTTPRRNLDGNLSHMTPLRQLISIRHQSDESMLLVSGADVETEYALRVKGEAESGLLHSIRKKARVGFFTCEDTDQTRHPMSDDDASLDRIINTVNSVRPQGEAPLATTLYAVHEYLRQDGRRGPEANDPFYFPFRGQTAPCSRQSVILITAGESSGDHNIPDSFKNVVVRTRPEEDYLLHPSGSTYLIDVAYMGHTTDLRPEAGMDGMQNWNFYTISLADGPCSLLIDAARHGKFTDSNGNNLPDLQVEFDSNGDGIPDNLFTAQSGRELETSITRVLQLDTRGVASGSAMAVASLARGGEGAAYQAIFFPPNRTNQIATSWSGQVHAYFMDTQGNLREDTDANQHLDLTADRVIEFDGELIHAHVDANGDGIIEDGERNSTTLGSIADIRFLWSTSSWLNSLTDQQAATQRTPYDGITPNRYILTFVDTNRDMVADAAGGEIQHFALPATPADTTLNSPEFYHNFLTLYESASGRIGLDLADPVQCAINTLKEENSSGFSNFQATLAKRQVDFIRGAEVGNATVEGIIDVARSRVLGGTPWRLGDTVFSSPTAVGRPAENYHLIYNDTTYEAFLKKYMDRRQVVYAGANDGMLHAFNGGFWNRQTRTFDVTQGTLTQFPLGMELWAYVPYNLLPHLKWLMHPDYGEKLHVAYMDLEPQVFDARIFFMSDGVTPVDEDIYPGGWGTILVAGMRLGGAAIQADIDKTDGSAFNADIDRTVTSAYVIMDVTDPESPPNVLAEISMPEQGFTTCAPAVMPMSNPNAESAATNKWYMVFGSGPADVVGRADRAKLMHESSEQGGKLFALDLSALVMDKTVKTVDSTGLTSSKCKPFAFTEAGSFISAPVCVDLDVGSKNSTGKFSTDLVYFGTVAGDSSNPAGKVYRLRTGNDTPAGWTMSTLVEVGGPVSAAPSVAIDEKGRLWIYFGTGRFFNRDDIPQTSPMGFYGIKEPETDGVKNWETIPAQNLFDSNKVAMTGGTCEEGEYSQDCVGIIYSDEDTNSARDWAWLTSSLDLTPGWKHDFNEAQERVLGPAAVMGGSVVFTSYIPAEEACSADGTSRLWALFFKTGTPFFWPTLQNPNGKIPAAIEIGQGLITNPTLHIGEKPTATALTQSNFGVVLGTEINTPFPIKSGGLFWRKNTD